VFQVYSQLTKFGIVIFVLLAGLAGYATGFFVETQFSFKHLMTFVGGLYFLSSGSLALNQFQEYKLDRLMPRTQKRPLATGRLKPMAGLIIALTLLILGLAMLFDLSVAAGWIGILSVALYNGIYTYIWKPKWIFGAVPGAIPGALPITIGYAVNDPNIFNLDSVYLFLIMFLWQMPHFWLLAMKYKDDYKLGGIPTLPVALGVDRTIFHIGLYTFAYVGVAIASPFFLNVSWMYLFLVFPFVFFLLKEFFIFYKTHGQQRWFAFFMWINFSMLVFVFVPVIDKWSFLFIGRH